MTRKVTEYRLSWESVDSFFCATAEQRFGRDVWQRTSWDEFIPEHQWHTTSVVFTEGRWDQYNLVRKWADTHEQPIRNVRLEKRQSPNPDEGWEPYEGQQTNGGDSDA